MTFYNYLPSAIFVAHVLIVVGITVRVIMQRPAAGVALAWLFLVALLPFAGALIYFLVGEKRIGHRRRREIGTLRTDFRKISDAAIRGSLSNVDWSRHATAARGIDRLGQKTVGSITVHGSSFQLYSDTHKVLEAIAREVDQADSGAGVT
ncbi:MAG: PLDc N-terminal domain-containing protein [Desulfobacterales bacterium]